MTALAAVRVVRVHAGRALACAGALTAFAALVGAAQAAVADAAGGATGSATSDPALRVLERAAQAGRSTPYTGVQYLTAWTDDGAVSVLVDVSHQPGRGSMVRVHPTPNSGGAQVYDSDDSGPDASVAGLTGLAAGPFTLLANHYRLALDGSEPVAGRPSDVVVARRGDGSVAGRFWVDRTTGLLVRREVLDERGRTVRSSAFFELQTGRQSPTQPLMSGPSLGAVAAVPPPWGVSLGPDRLAQLRAGGWTAPQSLAGLALYDARLSSSGHDQVLHLSYSDGLSTVSVFEQAGHLEEGNLDGYKRDRLAGASVWVRETLPERVVWSTGGRVYTVLADAAPTVVRSAVTGLPHGSHHRGFWSRLGHGLARIVSWINPFG